MPCLQGCPQWTKEKKICMPQTGGRVLVTSRDYFLWKLHSAFEIALWFGEKEDSPQSAEKECRAAGYFAMVSADVGMRLSICEGLHCSARMVAQKTMKSWAA